MDGSEDSEVLDGEVVPADETASTGTAISGLADHAPVRITSAPAIQTAAVAAGGFLAGAAVASLVSHRMSARAPRSARSPRLRRGGRTGRAGELIQIVGTRSLLVDIHLLDGPGGRR